ncbi:hypothetical protein Tco_1549275 [Tanacetum coccineum]
MRANSHHRLGGWMLCSAVALKRGVATAAAVGPAQAAPIVPILCFACKNFCFSFLIDYQLDPVTLPPSPSSPFPMAAYQRMITKTDPTQREEALTAYGTETGQGSVLFPETALTVCTM